MFKNTKNIRRKFEPPKIFHNPLYKKACKSQFPWFVGEKRVKLHGFILFLFSILGMNSSVGDTGTKNGLAKKT